MFKYLIKKQFALLYTQNVKKFSSKDSKRNKLNFFDKIKEKFSIKTEERINYSELNNRNEAEDQVKASKLENAEDYDDDSNIKNQGLMNASELAIEKIDINLQFETVDEESKMNYNSTQEYLLAKYKINTQNFGKDYEEVFTKSKWEEIDIRCEKVKKMGFNDFHIKTIINKM
jgi:hypothetical protein